jgi:hypothetical protein
MCTSHCFFQEAESLELQQLLQRNEAVEKQAEEKQKRHEAAQRALRLQLAETNASVQQRAELERQREREEDAAALEYTRKVALADIARQHAADAERLERDRAHSVLLQTAQRAANNAVRHTVY